MWLKIIEQKIEVVENKGLKAKCIVVHPEMERSIFTQNELPKSSSLEEHFSIPVILSKEVSKGVPLIGV